MLLTLTDFTVSYQSILPVNGEPLARVKTQNHPHIIMSLTNFLDQGKSFWPQNMILLCIDEDVITVSNTLARKTENKTKASNFRKDSS